MTRRFRLLAIGLACSGILAMASAALGATPHPVQVRPGFMTGNSDVGTDVSLDLLIPLWGDEQRLLFFNPNLRFDDSDGNEQNIGFGYRRLSDCGHFIAGANLFYDTMRSPHGERYHQWGLGAELLSHWVDLRANYYDPFGDTDNVVGGSGTTAGFYFSGHSLMAGGGLQVEEALDGFDAEVAVLIPGLSDLMETRLAATYYNFDTDGDDLDGWRGRLEVRPVKAVNLSVEYRDDDARGSDTFVGGYLELPFAVDNLLTGKNPFAGAGDLWAFGQGARPLSERMTDKVVRDRHIVTAASETQGDGAGQAVVEDAMIFVNQDNPNPGDGSYENPYQTLDQAAADSRYRPGAWLYVFSSDANADTYANTHLTLLDDMVFWGQGYTHPVYGLGGGPMPILDGGHIEPSDQISGPDPVIFLANNNEIMGLTIQHGIEGIFANSYWTGKTVRDVFIHDNLIRDNLRTRGEGSGIHIYSSFDADDLADTTLRYTITNNVIENNEGSGIYLFINANNGNLDRTHFVTTITGNSIAGDGRGSGIDVILYADGSIDNIRNSSAEMTVTNNVIENAAYGLNIRSTFNGNSQVAATVETSNVSIINNISGNVVNVSQRGLYLDNEIDSQSYGEGGASHLNAVSIENRVENNEFTGGYVGIYLTNGFWGKHDITNANSTSLLAGNEIRLADYPGSTICLQVNDSIYAERTVTGTNQMTLSATGNLFSNQNEQSRNSYSVWGVWYLSRTDGTSNGAATATADFGGGPLGSLGNNRFEGFVSPGWDVRTIYNQSPFSVSAANNWWGTTDLAIIGNRIVEEVPGLVVYQPILTSSP